MTNTNKVLSSLVLFQQQINKELESQQKINKIIKDEIDASYEKMGNNIVEKMNILHNCYKQLNIKQQYFCTIDLDVTHYSASKLPFIEITMYKDSWYIQQVYYESTSKTMGARYGICDFGKWLKNEYALPLFQHWNDIENSLICQFVENFVKTNTDKSTSIFNERAELVSKLMEIKGINS